MVRSAHLDGGEMMENRKHWIELIYYAAGIVALSLILGMVIGGMIWLSN